MCVRRVFLVCYPSWRSFPLLLRTACYSGTDERTPFRSHVLPHMTLVASCGVFVIFRGAERFVFRARTDPKDAMPRRRCGEGRANVTSSEAELNGRLRPSNRGRRHGVAAYPRRRRPKGSLDGVRSRPFGREFSCFSPEGSAGRGDKPTFQRRKPRFSAAMKNQG